MCWLAVCGTWVVLCQCQDDVPTGATPDAVAPTAIPQFTDVTAAAGISFVHVNGASGRRYYLETYGSGAAFLDYDGDGHQDLYIVNSAPLPGFQTDTPPTNALYRNQGDGTFADVTEAAGVGHTGYGMGVCAGDYDNDGHIDIYVTNFGPNVLYRNRGDGTFEDVTAAAAVGDDRVGSSAAFADWDADGDLDLYVANYAKFSVETNKTCYQGTTQVYCDPAQYDGDSGVFYRNEGDGTFADVTRQVGGYTEAGRQLGVVFGDYDNDSDVDLYVANDGMANFLFRNEGDGTFRDVGMVSGSALNEGGRPEAGMGTDFGDYDNDGDLDIVVCNFQWESCRLFENDGNGHFADATSVTDVAAPTLSVLTFGTDFFDCDNDGHLDLFMANGHVNDNAQLFDASVSYPQRDQIFRNDGKGTFVDVTSSSGPGLELVMVGRGAAFGDYDNDGDIDVFVLNNNQRGVLLRNGGVAGNHWITLTAVGSASNRDGIGARIQVTAGDLVQVEEVRSGSSYLSQNDLRVHFGLGAHELVDRIEIRWPSGAVQVLQDVAVDQFLTIEEPSQP